MTPPPRHLFVRARVEREAVALDVTCEIGPGVTVLMGPSGVGKSTLLLAIAGHVRPTKGHIALGGCAWFDDERKIDLPPHKRNVAIVFQSLALFPHLTALENVAYAVPRSLGKPERRERAHEMLRWMKVDHLAGRKPKTFSGGEAQRVALARAFAQSPELVLLDEAFSALDRELRRTLCAELKERVDAWGIPTLLVTHHHMEARALGRSAILLQAGRIYAQGSVQEVLEAEKSLESRREAEAASEMAPLRLVTGHKNEEAK